jgi:hypothetical protein
MPRKRVSLDDQEIRELAGVNRADLLRKPKQRGGRCRRLPIPTIVSST